MQDPLRLSMLARMGILGWQLRQPELPIIEPTARTEVADPASEALPTSKLWLLAPSLPAQPLLEDICQLLGISPNEITLINALPPNLLQSAKDSPLVWLTAADPALPNALICPINPDGVQKKALWQQLRTWLTATAQEAAECT